MSDTMNHDDGDPTGLFVCYPFTRGGHTVPLKIHTYANGHASFWLGAEDATGGWTSEAAGSYPYAPPGTPEDVQALAVRDALAASTRMFAEALVRVAAAARSHPSYHYEEPRSLRELLIARVDAAMEAVLRDQFAVSMPPRRGGFIICGGED